MDSKFAKKKSKEEKIRNKSLKPLADNLQDHPKLKKQLEKISGKPHPIDTHCWLNTLLVSYARSYINLSQKLIFTQSCHYNLPKNDQVLKVRDKLGSQLYQKKGSSNSSPGEAGSDGQNHFYGGVASGEELGFRMTQHLNKMTLPAFLAAYWQEFTLLVVTTALAGAFNFGAVFLTKEGLDIISDQIAQNSKITDKEVVLFYFGMVWFFGALNAVLKNWTFVLISRITTRFFSGYTSLVFEKLLRVGLTNPFEHGEGSIINYLQNDLMSMDNAVYQIAFLATTTLNIPLALALGYSLFGFNFIVIIVGICLLSYINALIMEKSVPIYNRWTQKTDSRLQLLKNVLSNIKFIKIGALENTFFMKLVQKRKEELMQRVYFLNFYAFLEFVISMGTALIIISFLLAYFMTDQLFTVGGATALLQVIDLLKMCLNSIPSGLSSVASIIISSKRVDLFLEARELDAPSVYAKSDPGSQYALEIKNGYFYWDKKISADEAAELREAQIKERSSRKLKKNREKKEAKEKSFDGQSRKLAQTLLTVESNPTRLHKHQDLRERSFVLEDLNFKAERGKLTVIIGKIGSGKSSILNALMGEMRVSDTSKTSIHVNGSISYQGQNPWLINGTVKENILLNKEYNQEKFNWALKYSALELDLKTWDKRELHEVGESGTALSGGQRARISLARCLYQE